MTNASPLGVRRLSVEPLAKFLYNPALTHILVPLRRLAGGWDHNKFRIEVE